MPAHGITIAEECHVVNILAPVDINGGVTSDYFSLKGYAHATIIVQMGVTGGTSAMTVTENTTNVGGGATAIEFASYKEETDQGDTLESRVATTSSGLTSSANDNIFYVFEIDAQQLSDGSPYLAVVFATPGASVIASAVAILSGTQYQQDVTETAIT